MKYGKIILFLLVVLAVLECNCETKDTSKVINVTDKRTSTVLKDAVNDAEPKKDAETTDDIRADDKTANEGGAGEEVQPNVAPIVKDQKKSVVSGGSNKNNAQLDNPNVSADRTDTAKKGSGNMSANRPSNDAGAVPSAREQNELNRNIAGDVNANEVGKSAIKLGSSGNVQQQKPSKKLTTPSDADPALSDRSKQAADQDPSADSVNAQPTSSQQVKPSKAAVESRERAPHRPSTKKTPLEGNKDENRGRVDMEIDDDEDEPPALKPVSRTPAAGKSEQTLAGKEPLPAGSDQDDADIVSATDFVESEVEVVKNEEEVEDDQETEVSEVLPMPVGGKKPGFVVMDNKVVQEDTKETPSSGHFMKYFVMAMVVIVVFYIIYHNKQRILAYIVEGRSGRSTGRRRTGGTEYRPVNTEEALPSLAEKGESPKSYVY